MPHTLKINALLSEYKNNIKGSDEFLVFKIDNENYGIEINAIIEIRTWSEPTRLPNTPEYLLGVINVRGTILPIFDLRSRLGIGRSVAHDKKIIIFINNNNLTMGMLVDSVSDIIQADRNALQPTSNIHGYPSDEFIRGLYNNHDKMVILLNTSELMSFKNPDGNLNGHTTE